jgi:hypothetical protein
MVMDGDKSNYPIIWEIVRYHMVMSSVPWEPYQCKKWLVVIIIAHR